MKEARCSIDGIMEKRNIGSVPNKGPHFVWGSTVNLGVHSKFGGSGWGSKVHLSGQGSPKFGSRFTFPVGTNCMCEDELEVVDLCFFLYQFAKEVTTGTEMKSVNPSRTLIR